jgi:hypothetical protein
MVVLSHTPPWKAYIVTLDTLYCTLVDFKVKGLGGEQSFRVWLFNGLLKSAVGCGVSFVPLSFHYGTKTEDKGGNLRMVKQP